jgi:hypothetical protein
LTHLDQNSLFRKNIQFSALIKAGASLREFNFRRSTRTDEEPYFVDVADERGERRYFSMTRQSGGWRLTGAALPAWVVSAEKQLEEAILASDPK